MPLIHLLKQTAFGVLASFVPLTGALVLVGCVSPPDASTRYLGESPVSAIGGPNPFRAEIEATVAAEPPGDYWVGRRYFKDAYKFWGYIKRPRAPWSTAKLVMLNENRLLAPDRDGKLGRDDGAEYHLRGRFSGGALYDPSSNGFYPEFILEGFELINPNPPSVFREGKNNDPTSNIIQRPQ